MSSLHEIRKLLGLGTTRVSGTVKSVGSWIQVATPKGQLQCPAPNFVVKPNDMVVLESNQILYNVGQQSQIPIRKV